MSLINCPECKKPVSETANACPGCSFTLTPEIVAEQKEKKQKEGQAGVLIALGVFLVFVVLCSGLSRPSSTPSEDSSAQVKAQAHLQELMNYKSTKPVSEMDGQEKHEFDEAWKYMSDEEKMKQTRRDFGG